MARDNDIMSESFNQEIPEPEQPKSSRDAPWPIQIAGAILVACALSILVSLTIRLDRWILQ